MLRFTKIVLTALVIIWAAELSTPSRAFDVSTYFDPYSMVYTVHRDNIACWELGNCWSDTPACTDRNFARWLQSVAQYNDSALKWYEEMGLTNLCVVYPTDSAYLWDNIRNYDFDVMNDLKDNTIYRYTEAQSRTVVFGDDDNQYVAPNDTIGSWGRYTDTRPNQDISPTELNQTALSFDTLAADTFFRPAKNFGWWMGWNRVFDNSTMPLVVTLRGKVDSVVADTFTIAKLYFFCHMPDWWHENQPQRYVRFGPREIKNHDFDDGGDYYGKARYWIDPQEYDIFSKGGTAWEGEQAPPDSFISHEQSPFMHEGWRWAGKQFEYRVMIVTDSSVLPFSLYDMKVSDLAYHQMFDAWPSETTDSLAYYEEYIGNILVETVNKTGGVLDNWYADEWDFQFNDPMATIAGIMNQRLGTGPIINGAYIPYDGEGGWRVSFHESLDEISATVNVEMCEFYPFGGDSTCRPVANRWEFLPDPEYYIPGDLWTDYSSDVAYFDFTRETDCPAEFVCKPPAMCGPDSCDPAGEVCHFTFESYSGKQSLQCALDAALWGRRGVADMYDLPYQHDSLEFRGNVAEVKSVHQRGEKFWNLIQARGEGARNFDHTNWQDKHANRIPTPNEIALTAWLSVGMDADGIMWYWGTSAMDITPEPQDGLGGLLEWQTRDPFCDTKVLVKTPQYDAAKEVCNDIHKIAPTLEGLDFIRTYGSRVFEQNYGESDSSWIRVDTLDATGNRSCWLSFSSDDNVTGPLDEDYEDGDSTYIQISRFMSPGKVSSDEDYWFLIVNRRVLEDEDRTIYIHLNGVEYADSVYMFERYLEGTDSIAWIDPQGHYPNTRHFNVTLAPGEAELVHFYRPDTTDLVLSGNVTLKAPAYYNRNIILDSATVTIIPDTALQRYQIIKGGVWEDQWKDSLEILFAPGKGIKLVEPDSGSNKLRILGNDTTQIVLKCAKGGDFRWAGIQTPANGAGSAVTLKYATVTRADYGLRLTSPCQVDSLVGCKFIDNNVGVFTAGRREVRFSECSFEKNGNAVVAFNGSVVRGWDSDVTSSQRTGILGSNGCTLDLEEVSVTGGNYSKRYGGIRSYLSDTWLKCCKILDNAGIGLEAIGGSAILADVDTSNADARFGANQFSNNGHEELRLDGPMYVWMDEGYNLIYDLTVSERQPSWITIDRLVLPSDWHHNWWNGLTTDTDIWNHIGTFVEDSLGEPLRPDCTPALSQEPETCELPTFVAPNGGGCITSGLIQELEPDYISAESSYQSALASTAASCPKVPAVTRLLTVNHLGGTSATTTLNYLDAVLDTATDVETRHALKLGIALTLAEGLSNTDSAKTIYQQVIDSAGSDIYRRIDGQAGHLLVEMREEESDTVDGLTVEELSEFLDSLDQILGQRFVWTQYEITDSVVMYAPVRVDSVINVRGDGVLTILPHPGYSNPVVEFANLGAIKVYGTDTTKAKGKLYVLGEAENRVMLHWEDSTGTKNIFSERGFVKLLNADFYGNGFVNQTQDVTGYLNGLRRATFQADSCTFSWFDEGVMVKATDTTSYMRGCTLSYMGGNAGLYSGFGAGLVILKADGFLVEDCVFDENDGVGIYHGFANDVVIRNCVVKNGAKAGIYGASSAGGSARLECCTIESNGDTLPELWTLGVVYDLVGGHNSFSDSTGTLIKSLDPSYVDLENGENYLEILDEGRYVQSEDTNDTWDVTWNTWSPSAPDDPDFYDYLWPHTSSKWTVDSSLADFVSCGEAGTSSIGGGTWLVVDADDEIAGTMSTENANTEATALMTPHDSTSKTVQGKGASKSVSKGSVGSFESKQSLTRKQTSAERSIRHHRELSQWRVLRENKSRNAKQAAIQFVTENRGSEFVPAALGLIAGAASLNDAGYTSSKFLRDFALESKNRPLRYLAQRLSYQALALEGKPGDALSGLEEMMDEAKSPRDSVLAMLDAMQIYCDYHQSGSLKPKHEQLQVADPYDLVRRSLFLAERLDDPTLGVEDYGSAIPTSYALYQNYPNPFNPTTEIRFDLPEAIRVELKIFNILGQEVVTLVDDVRAAGAFRVLWDGKNAAGLTVASGVYIYQIKTPNFTDAKKMMLIR